MKKNIYENTNTEYYRAGIAQAHAEGLTLEELNVIVQHTYNGFQFDQALQAQVRLNELKPTHKKKGIVL